MKKVSPDPPKFHDFMVATETKKAGPSPRKGPTRTIFMMFSRSFHGGFLVVKLGTKRSPHGARRAPGSAVPPALFVSDVHGCHLINSLWGVQSSNETPLRFLFLCIRYKQQKCNSRGFLYIGRLPLLHEIVRLCRYKQPVSLY